MLTSKHLVVGNLYTRHELMGMFDIKDATINTGIFQPKDHESIWLFVTKDKTPDRTQYSDILDGDDLYIDGQNSGRTDAKLIHHERDGLEVILFYRRRKDENPEYAFHYEGRFKYIGHRGLQPAQFHFRRI